MGKSYKQSNVNETYRVKLIKGDKKKKKQDTKHALKRGDYSKIVDDDDE